MQCAQLWNYRISLFLLPVMFPFFKLSKLQRLSLFNCLFRQILDTIIGDATSGESLRNRLLKNKHLFCFFTPSISLLRSFWFPVCPQTESGIQSLPNPQTSVLLHESTPPLSRAEDGLLTLVLGQLAFLMLGCRRWYPRATKLHSLSSP